MNGKYIFYAVCVTIVSTVISWVSLFGSSTNTGRPGSGFSSGSSGGGSWGNGSGGGGHK